MKRRGSKDENENKRKGREGKQKPLFSFHRPALGHNGHAKQTHKHTLSKAQRQRHKNKRETMTRSLRPSNKQNALASASSATSSRKNEKRVAPKKTVVQVEPMPKRAPRTKTSWFMSISVTQSLMGATAFVVNSVSAVYLWTMASLVATFLPFYEMFMYFYAIFCHSIHQVVPFFSFS